MAAVETSEEAVAHAEEGGVRRRDFINIAAVAAGGVGAVGLLFPLINQMNPSADVLALAQIDVDVSHIQAGQAIKTIWRKQPIFIRNRTPDEIKAAKDVRLADLKDPVARNDALPDSARATDENRTKAGKENWLVMVGI